MYNRRYAIYTTRHTDITCTCKHGATGAATGNRAAVNMGEQCKKAWRHRGSKPRPYDHALNGARRLPRLQLTEQQGNMNAHSYKNA